MRSDSGRCSSVSAPDPNSSGFQLILVTKHRSIQADAQRSERVHGDLRANKVSGGTREREEQS